MRSRYFILLILIFLLSCQKQVSDEVSSVNGRSISQDDFIFAYETSPRSLQSGSKAQAYNKVLDRIIQRILLSQEAEKLGIQNEDETARELQLLEDAAIRRELFREKVCDQVHISDESLRSAFYRGQQTLWVRHADLGSNPPPVLNNWSSSWTHTSINPTNKTLTSEAFGDVDLISWNDVDQQLEDILFGMKLNELSPPIKRNGTFHVFQLVNIETNQMASENNYLLEKEHYHSIMQKRIEHIAAFNYVKKIMAPQNLIIRRESLNLLSQILWSHNTSKDELADNSSENSDLPGVNLDNISDMELATYASGSMSVGDFRLFYKMNPVDLSQKSLEALQYNITNAIGIYVRDVVFAEIGRQEGLAELPEVRQDFRYWQERLLAAKMEASIFQDVKDESPTASNDLNLKANEKLNLLCAELKQSAHIDINNDVLMGIKTSDAGLPRKIDFFASYLN